MLLAGQKGPAYCLVPVFGDVVLEDRELRRAMSKASLRKNWSLVENAEEAPGDEEIEREIHEVRASRQSLNGELDWPCSTQTSSFRPVLNREARLPHL